ncbi:MAG TPA: M3 family oligoendopeptidase [Anaerolineaceae bacterium]|nr:M3 family oligoendopeptidase [Anaerolineaceae bacterium]
MFTEFPKDPNVVLGWDWEDYQRYVDDLLAIDLTPDNVDAWQDGWSLLASALQESYNRRYVAHSVNTADQEAERAYEAFIEGIYPKALDAEQRLKDKLLESGLQPANFEIPMRNLRAEADLFRSENLDLLAEEQKLSAEYDRITSAQTVTWQGAEVTLTQLEPIFEEQDRERREQVWRLTMDRRLADRAALNELWTRLYDLRQQIARNAGRPDYRAYRWQQLLRFDYTPEDSLAFLDAIEQQVVPVAERIYARRKERLGVDRLRPWDLNVDPHGRPPLRPYRDPAELAPGTARIFHQVDPQLGANFDRMMQQNLLDLDNRKNKAPGGYCTDFPLIRLPFIFANAVGMHEDVQTLLHEGGHAFHTFESARQRRVQDLMVPAEFAEVASMSMEFIGGTFLAADSGGFYTPEEAARARIDVLEAYILFWPYMAVVDAFQHWAYTHPEGRDPAACDATWSGLWDRFMRGVDWDGLEAVKATGWHRKLHIFTAPFYYVEYGLALLGAVQVWQNWLRSPQEGIRAYRQALALGGTRPLPELFAAAGARLSFDADTLRSAVQVMESAVNELSGSVG